MAITRNESAEYTHWQPQQVKLVDGVPVRFSDVCVFEFGMSDVEDPDLYAAQPMWEWQESEAGVWIMENAAEKPYWTRHIDQNTYGYRYKIVARLTDQQQTFWRLKWGGIRG